MSGLKKELNQILKYSFNKWADTGLRLVKNDFSILLHYM